MLGEHQCSTGGRDNVTTCDALIQKQDSEASNLQWDLSNDVGEVLL